MSLYLSISLSVLSFVHAQYTIIRGNWTDDYSIKLPALSAFPGWQVLDKNGVNLDVVTNGRYHGPFLGDAHAPDFELYNISRYFQCNVRSTVFITYSIVFCGTEVEDYVRLYLNGGVRVHTFLTMTTKGGFGQPISDTSLESAAGCFSFERYDMGPYQFVGIVEISDVLTVEFRLVLTHQSDAVALTDIQLICDPVPTPEPSTRPSSSPTRLPSRTPSTNPSVTPSRFPSRMPSRSPSSRSPTQDPTIHPSTSKPTRLPSAIPSQYPTSRPPTLDPTFQPSYEPTTWSPSLFPTLIPSVFPSEIPSIPRPSPEPTLQPTPRPTRFPTWKPTNEPSPEPTPRPTRLPTTRSPSTESPTERDLEIPSIANGNAGFDSGSESESGFGSKFGSDSNSDSSAFSYSDYKFDFDFDSVDIPFPTHGLNESSFKTNGMTSGKSDGSKTDSQKVVDLASSNHSIRHNSIFSLFLIILVLIWNIAE